MTGEIFMVNKRVDVKGYLKDRPISLELAFFADGGIFYNSGTIRKLGDAGIGIRLSSTVYDKPLYLRLDFPFILFNDDVFHPSILTMAPTIGVAFLIYFCQKGEIITDFLSNRLFVGLGLISYSLYLWHYPIFSFSPNIETSFFKPK